MQRLKTVKQAFDDKWDDWNLWQIRSVARKETVEQRTSFWRFSVHLTHKKLITRPSLSLTNSSVKFCRTRRCQYWAGGGKQLAAESEHIAASLHCSTFEFVSAWREATAAAAAALTREWKWKRRDGQIERDCNDLCDVPHEASRFHEHVTEWGPRTLPENSVWDLINQNFSGHSNSMMQQHTQCSNDTSNVCRMSFPELLLRQLVFLLF